MDFFIWGFVKEKVFRPSLARNVNKLKNKIIASITDFTVSGNITMACCSLYILYILYVFKFVKVLCALLNLKHLRGNSVLMQMILLPDMLILQAWSSE